LNVLPGEVDPAVLGNEVGVGGIRKIPEWSGRTNFKDGAFHRASYEFAGERRARCVTKESVKVLDELCGPRVGDGKSLEAKGTIHEFTREVSLSTR
jgi:hypothetical protein